MAIEYKLIPDPTPENPDNHKAVVLHKNVANLDDIIDQILSKNRIDMDREEIRKTIESYLAAIQLAYIDGEKVMTPLLEVTEEGIEPGALLRCVADNIEVKRVD
ncbi:DNA-binding domain-containing protein [Fodinibius sediminis]|nr:DNA-binding domain-containing protein [Fodinibius sediminis]